jgi:hypothetical protein
MATVNTTWVTPAGATLDKATGATIDETMTDAWSSDLYHLGGTQGYIGVRATFAAAQSIANNASTALALTAEQFDHDPNGSIHDTSGVPVASSAVTCRTTGVYHMTGYATFAVSGTGVRQLALRLNGATYLASTTVAGLSGNLTDMNVATAYLMTATDYVELVAYQNSGGALNVTEAALTVVKA